MHFLHSLQCVYFTFLDRTQKMQDCAWKKKRDNSFRFIFIIYFLQNLGLVQNFLTGYCQLQNVPSFFQKTINPRKDFYVKKKNQYFFCDYVQDILSIKKKNKLRFRRKIPLCEKQKEKKVLKKICVGILITALVFPLNFCEQKKITIRRSIFINS